MYLRMLTGRIRRDRVKNERIRKELKISKTTFQKLRFGHVCGIKRRSGIQEGYGNDPLAKATRKV